MKLKVICLLIIFIFSLTGCLKKEIKEIKPDLIFGERGKKEGQFLNIDGIAVDSKENIYVTDIKKIQVFDKDGNFLYSIGEKYIKNEATGVGIDKKDRVIITDEDNYMCRIFTSEGELIKSFGKRGMEDGSFLEPQGICIDDEDRIYVSDNEGDSVQVFSPEGEFLLKFGKTGKGKGEFDEPESLALYNNKIYVADEVNGRIEYFDLQGKYLGEIGRKTASIPVFLPDDEKGSSPEYSSYFTRDVEGIVFDNEGHLYTANEDEGVIDIFNEKGDFLGEFTSAEKGGLKKIQGLAVNKDKTKLYVCDQGNSRIQVFDMTMK